MKNNRMGYFKSKYDCASEKDFNSMTPQMHVRYKKIANIVETYNDAIDELEQMGLVVGCEYDGHMEFNYDKKNFYINVAY